MTRLIVTADAERDSSDILNYLEREAGARVAEDFGHRFRVAIGRFVELPEIAPRRPALGANVRVAIIFPYLLIYDYARASETVTLLRILHGRRNISQNSLKSR